MKRILIITATLLLSLSFSMTVLAVPQKMADGRIFDPEYYAANNPDVVKVFGTKTSRLYQHYKQYGLKEGRKAYENEAACPAKAQTSDKQEGYMEQAKLFYDQHYDEMMGEIARINELRSSLGKTQLVADDTLMELACYRAYECATENFISHSYPDGVDCLDVSAPLYGLTCYVGENLCSFYYTCDNAPDPSVCEYIRTQDPFTSLKASPSHYENMIYGKWKKVGVGVAKSNGWWMYVMLFTK